MHILFVVKTKSENERLKLEIELDRLINSDGSRLKAQAIKLKAYYAKLCTDESRSMTRNQTLLNDLQRIDAQLQQFESKLERLNNLRVMRLVLLFLLLLELSCLICVLFVLKKECEAYLRSAHPIWTNEHLTASKLHSTAIESLHSNTLFNEFLTRSSNNNNNNDHTGGVVVRETIPKLAADTAVPSRVNLESLGIGSLLARVSELSSPNSQQLLQQQESRLKSPTSSNNNNTTNKQQTITFSPGTRFVADAANEYGGMTMATTAADLAAVNRLSSTAQSMANDTNLFRKYEQAIERQERMNDNNENNNNTLLMNSLNLTAAAASATISNPQQQQQPPKPSRSPAIAAAVVNNEADINVDNLKLSGRGGATDDATSNNTGNNNKQLGDTNKSTETSLNQELLLMSSSKLRESNIYQEFIASKESAKEKSATGGVGRGRLLDDDDDDDDEDDENDELDALVAPKSLRSTASSAAGATNYPIQSSAIVKSPRVGE